jgi:hypothetical protein
MVSLKNLLGVNRGHVVYLLGGSSELRAFNLELGTNADFDVERKKKKRNVAFNTNFDGHRYPVVQRRELDHG